MAERREKQLCPTCGRVSYCDRHHPLGEVHAPAITIPSCIDQCHPTASERQQVAGVALEHDRELPFAERLWAFDSGLSDLLFLTAFNKPYLGEPEARAVERSASAVGRLADRVARSVGEPGIEGPSPRANAMRLAGRRTWRRPDRSVPAEPHPFDPETAPQRVQALLGVVAEAIETMPPHDRVDEVLSLAQSITESISVLGERCGELEARGHGPTLMRCLAVGRDHRQTATEALERVHTPRDGYEAAPAIQSYTAYGDSFLAFLRELSEARDVEEAEAALRRLADAVIR